MVALFAGLRRGELLALRWHRLDLEAGSLKVEASVELTKAGPREKQPKTAAGKRELMLPARLVEVLREHYRTQREWSLKLGLGRPACNALVFPRDDDPAAFDSPRALSSAWKLFADKNGMKGVRFHDLRHTHASILIDQKIDIAMVSKRLGHSTPGITLSIYSHQFAASVDRAAAALDAFISGLQGKSK
jgi:integrase